MNDRRKKSYPAPHGLPSLEQIPVRPLIYLNSNNDHDPSFIAAGKAEELRKDKSSEALSELQGQHREKSDWLFGYLGYGLKNEVENLPSNNPDPLNFPVMYFFRPVFVAYYRNGSLTVEYLPGHIDEKTLDEYFETRSPGRPPRQKEKPSPAATGIRDRTGEARYLRDVKALKDHIKQGDIYEVNYCREFYIEGMPLDPIATYKKLNHRTEAPFSCFLEFGNHSLICGSPERYLKKTGARILSQPIKGTAPRGKTAEEDCSMAEELRKDPKERSENVMIVDLVRNDLSRIAENGSVRVEDLYGIHSFKTVHQGISTISCQMRPELHWSDAIRATFPMGSMTGAPKIRAMELIDKFEPVARGIFSGAVGYITPAGDLDLNVVIRSIMHERQQQYTSMKVGGAITDRSVPEKEHEECLLKAEALKRSLVWDDDKEPRNQPRRTETSEDDPS